MKINILSSFIVALVISQVTTAYSPPVAREMAYMSAIAYESVLTIQAWNCKLCS